MTHRWAAGRPTPDRRPQERRTRIRRIILAAMAAAVLVVPVSAYAIHGSAVPAHPQTRHNHPTICERAYTARVIVKHRFGQAGAGRNICRYGVRTHERPRGAGRHATTAERARYLNALEQLAKAAPPYLTVVPGPPHIGASGTLTVHYRPVGLAACIVNVESRGNPRASNGSHTGVGQWTGEAWARMRGLRFAASPLGATLDEQLLTLSYGLEHWGCRDWCPFDPC